MVGIGSELVLGQKLLMVAGSVWAIGFVASIGSKREREIEEIFIGCRVRAEWGEFTGIWVDVVR